MQNPHDKNDAKSGDAKEPTASHQQASKRSWWVTFLIRAVAVLVLFYLLLFPLFWILNERLGNYPPVSSPDAKPVSLSQGVADDWGLVGLKWFAHTSQGTMVMPYKWFIALEQPGLTVPPLAAQPFHDRVYLSKFGFLSSEAHESFNPDGLLPVGFAIERDFEDPRDVYSGQDVVGLTCAACHTGKLTIRQPDKSLVSLRVQGGSGSVDLRAFQDAIGKAVGITLKDPFRLHRFQNNVLGKEATKEDRQLLAQQLQRWLDDALKSNEENKRIRVFDLVPSGPGRTDALALIGNRVFGLRDGAAAVATTEDNINANLQIANAPVNFPPIWDTSWFDWVQYNGSIRMVMVRNIGEALGVGARTNMDPKSDKFLTSSVNVRNLHLLEDFLGGNEPFAGLRHPKWQDAVSIAGLPELNSKLVDSGRELYQKFCLKCHLPAPDELLREYSKPESIYWTKPELPPPFDKRFLHLRRIPLERIGTDPLQAVNFAFRTARFPSHDESIPFITLTASSGLRLITESLRAKAYEKLSPEEVMQWDRFRKHDTSLPDSQVVEAPLVYRPRPHNGIWATPPYLHNGSVPTLRQLLSPVDKRSESFAIGSTMYDPENVGLADLENTSYFRFDTRLAGNRNIGHEFRNLTLIELEIAYGLAGTSNRPTEDERWAATLGLSKADYLALSDPQRLAAKRVLTEAVLRVRDLKDNDPYGAAIAEYNQPEAAAMLESVVQDYQSMGESLRSDIRKQAVSGQDATAPKVEAAVAPNVGSSSFTGVIGPLLSEPEKDALLEYLKSL